MMAGTLDESEFDTGAIAAAAQDLADHVDLLEDEGWETPYDGMFAAMDTISELQDSEELSSTTSNRVFIPLQQSDVSAQQLERVEAATINQQAKLFEKNGVIRSIFGNVCFNNQVEDSR